MNRQGLRLLIFALAGATLRAAAQESDPFLAAESSDAFELARVVDREGDDAVLSRLRGEDVDAAARLTAVRAAPVMGASERALEPLAELAAGRDPDIAPAAARAMLEIARGLDPQVLDAREVMREELAPARAAAARLGEDQTARPDLRRVALVVVEILGSLGVP